MALRAFLLVILCAFASVQLHAVPKALARTPSAGYAVELGDLINDYRAELGLAPLQFADDLTALARHHSAEMADEHKLSHDGFQRRFRSANSPHCVENVGWNYREPSAQLEGWQKSPEHDRNLRDARISRMGIAAASSYVTFFACR